MLTIQNEQKLMREIEMLEKDLVSRQERKRQKESMQKRIDMLTLFLREIKDEQRHLTQARLFAIKFQNDKRLKDSETIRMAMKAASELVLTEKRVLPEIKTTPGKYPQSMIVVTRGDRIVSLEATEGTGVTESVSLLTLLSVLQSTQFAKVCFLDEYFSSVSPSNSIRISGSLNELIDGKIQAFLIEQKNEIFEQTSYREFHIRHDGIESHVETNDVVFTDGESFSYPYEIEEE